MSQYKPYPKYKPSGVDGSTSLTTSWIGDVPEGWEKIQSRHIFYCLGGNGFPVDLQGKDEGGYPFCKVSDINDDSYYVDKSNNYVDSEEVKMNRWNIIPRNSIIFAKVGEALKKNHRKINQRDCLIDNNMMALAMKHPVEDNIKYFFYALTSVDMRWFVNPGAIPSLNVDEWKNFYIPRPNFEEQQQIANFLDKKTARIDELIDKKQKMIKLLKEKRSAIINQAVTKGLDPNAKMKPSGIDWVGDIPEGWELEKLKYWVELINEIQELDDEVFLVDLENIEGFTGELLNEIQSSGKGMKKFMEGDVLFNKLRPYLSKVFYGIKDGCCGGELLVLRSNGHISAKFLFYRVLSSNFIDLVNNSAYGAKMPRASWDFIGNIFLPYPNKLEQLEISNFLDKKIAKIDSLLDQISTAIEKLREYRSSIITAAVTGKIDVREGDL